MKIKELIRILQLAPDKAKEVWIPAFDGERTTFIDFNFDDENNLDLYEVIKEVEPYTLEKITELEKLNQ
ncbi:MAG: hypothetical protein LBT56_04845 [Prevotellaceae bacterium]|jgi:hypothetical protein|nr:hypothetical protein [Prevotellaceae bacterium]